MERLSFREKAGFSVGELAGSGLWQIMIIFLPMFYTDTIGLPAAAVGTLFMVVRIFDGLNDPVMGMIADRTRTRWGRFRPYLLWGALPFGVMSFLLFLGPALAPGGKLAYAYVTYTVMTLLYTMTMIPFAALSGVMTSDYWDRTSLNAFRFIGAFAGAMMVQGLVKPGVRFFGGADELTGFRWTMALYGAACVLFFLVAFASGRERVRPASEKRNRLSEDLGDLSRNLPWLIVMTVSLVFLVAVSIRSSGQLYYFKYYVKNDGLVSAFMVAGTAATIAAILLTKPLTRLLDKKALFIGSLLAAAASSLAFRSVAPSDTPLLFSLQIVFSFACGPVMPLLWSMMGDAADYSEWKSGRRATGLVFSASTFSFKVGGAVGGALAMLLLSRYGYVANAEQNAETLGGMRDMLSLWPAAGAALCAAVLAFYPLNAGLLQGIEKDLKARKAETEGAA